MPASEPRSKRRIPWSARIVLALAAFGLLGACGIYALGLAATARWERYAAELRAAGEPLTFREIEALRTAMPAHINGARVIERLASELSDLPTHPKTVEERVLVFGRGTREVDVLKGIPRYCIEPSERFVAEHRELMDKLRTALDFPTGRFYLAYRINPYETPLPHLSPLHSARKLTELNALVALLDGNSAEAVESIQLLLRFSAMLNEEPVLISRRQQDKFDRTAVRLLEAVLRAGELGESELAMLSEQIGARLATVTMKWAQWGERAGFAQMCDELASGRVSPSWFKTVSNLDGTSRSTVPAWLPMFVLRENQIRGTELLTSVIAAGDSFQSKIAAMDRFAAELGNLSRRYSLVKTALGTYKRTVVEVSGGVAHLRSARAALAMERFRLKSGRFPESMTQLVPEHLDAAPVDPFDEKPLRMAPTESGMVIYSVGADLVDDVSRVGPEDAELYYRDVGFRLVRPVYRGLVITDEPPGKED
jgi:hypothetical protein